MFRNRVKPCSDQSLVSEQFHGGSSIATSDRSNTGIRSHNLNGDQTDFDSISTLGVEDSSYLKLKPFTRLDPSLERLLTFLSCFGVVVNPGSTSGPSKSIGSKLSSYLNICKIILMFMILYITGEVVVNVNLYNSKLIREQKRSTPLLTFVIVAYNWMTIVIPAVADLSLLIIGTRLFRFYSRTTATVCGGVFFGKTTSVDSYYYYVLLVLLSFLDALGQVVVLGIWPRSVTPYIRFIVSPVVETTSLILGNGNEGVATVVGGNSSMINDTLPSNSSTGGNVIEAKVLDFILGETYAHSDLGICLKILCLMIQFFHSYAPWIIVIVLANHYAFVINNINRNLSKYDFRRLLKQLIIMRDSSEQISLIVSIPFAAITILVFMRQIALNGVFIQSTMTPLENWAISLQSITSSLLIFLVFFFCDGLQSASKQTHRLKTERTVINANQACDQSMYESLDYLSRLSKSIRVTFFNIITINKSSLVGLYGHILTLTFVTS